MYLYIFKNKKFLSSHTSTHDYSTILMSGSKIYFDHNNFFSVFKKKKKERKIKRPQYFDDSVDEQYALMCYA